MVVHSSLPRRGPRWSGPVAALVLLLGTARSQESSAQFVAHAAPTDVDGDGIDEVESLALLHEAGVSTAPTVVVLVEARLLAQRANVATLAVAGLRERLQRHAEDLAAEGFHALLVEASVHHGPPHQDGRTVLGLRRFLRACHARSPLAAAVLVGHFPDALLVRTCNWRRTEALELTGPDGKPVAIDASRTNVRSVPEFVAHRCDVVLADLDGDWESVYVAGPTDLQAVTAVFAANTPEGGGLCVGVREGALHVADVFHVHDGTATFDRAAFAVAIDDADRDHECGATDRKLGNVLAQPDIAVSRIDARGVAFAPSARCLDALGQPQTVELAEGEQAAALGAWTPDPALELRLLHEYLDRNHAYRTSRIPDAAHRPTSISWGLGSGLHELRTAQTTWRGEIDAGCDVTADVDLRSVLAWLRRPAVLRTLRAHSDPFVAAFAATNVEELELAIGGPPWHWRSQGKSLVPSLQNCAGGRADFFFYRTLWQDHALPAQPYLLVHTGCEALSPPGACEHAYDDVAYGRFAHADSMLFFTPCLAIVGRAKVFYDEPRGFCESLAAGATFGAAWQRYFAVEGAAATWDEVGGDIGRKRAYFWSVVGDCTLRLPG